MAESSPGNDDFSLNRYREYLRALAEASLGQQPAGSIGASQVVRDALATAQNARDEFRGKTEEELAAWLRGVLNETLASALRAGELRREDSLFNRTGTLAGAFAHLAELHADPALPSGQLASRNEQLLRLATALERLPEDQRAVVEMKHLHGLSVAEICERTGRAKHNVVGLLYHGLMTLRKLMDERLKDRPPD